MDFIVEWWHWALLGMGLILVELVLPFFVLLWFGVGALAVASIVAIVPLSLQSQIIVWIALSVPLVLVWMGYFRRRFKSTDAGQASAEIVGEIGMVIQAIAPFRQGKVRFQKPVCGSDTWSVLADREIASGEKVRVIKVEGNLLTVAKLSES